jgi:predicted phosphodiesterase
LDKIIVHKLPDFEFIELYPICDFHDGDPKTDENMFKGFVKFIAAEPYRYWLYAGDNLNNAIKSSVSNVYNEKRSPFHQKEHFIDLVRPIANKCLCFVPGNHEARSSKETDCQLVWDIACRLVGDDKARELYRENEAFVKVSFGHYTDSKHSGIALVTYIMWVVHGNGGGMYVGNTVNKMQLRSMAIEGIDIAICGHVHKGKVGHSFPVRVVNPRQNIVTMRSVHNAICSAWADFGGYAARKLMIPGAKGALPIVFSGRRKEIEVRVGSAV